MEININNISSVCAQKLTDEDIAEIEKGEEECQMDISIRVVYQNFGTYEAQVFDNKLNKIRPLATTMADTIETAIQQTLMEWRKYEHDKKRN
mgnify:CR=1 FL=1